MKSDITVFSARKIHTMSAERSIASHIAVADNKIIGVGSLEELSGLGDFVLDEQFKDKVIMPGLVEGHSHIMEGHLWRYIYVGYFDRKSPDGTVWKGLSSIDDIIDRLIEYSDTADGKPVIGWGFDPIYFSGQRMSASDLDKVSSSEPVYILHANSHCLNVNSVILNRGGIDKNTNVEGVLKDTNGLPTGELRELAAMFVAFEVAGSNIFDEMGSAEDLWRFSQISRAAGVTTASELYSPLNDEVVSAMQRVSADSDFPLRLLVSKSASTANPESDVKRVKKLAELNTDKLRFGSIKIMTDGSIQGFTARLKSDRYYNNEPNGIWNAPPDEIANAIQTYHCAGVKLHIHTNGDEAIELMIDAIEAAINKHKPYVHNHVLQHCQLITMPMLEKCAELGIGINLFANHIYYWGDQHAALTIGPVRATQLDPVGSALKSGVNFSIHSDAPITPLAPLFTAWCAVNRLTATNHVLGKSERVPVDDALYAVTMGAAQTQDMDHLIGSLEIGKFADFAVLNSDPYEVDPVNLKDIEVHGVVLNGQPFLN